MIDLISWGPLWTVVVTLAVVWLVARTEPRPSELSHARAHELLARHRLYPLPPLERRGTVREPPREAA